VAFATRRRSGRSGADPVPLCAQLVWCELYAMRNVKRRRPGLSSPSMPHLVFWPRAGAFGASAILPPCAQLLWCEL